MRCVGGQQNKSFNFSSHSLQNCKHYFMALFTIGPSPVFPLHCQYSALKIFSLGYKQQQKKKSKRKETKIMVYYGHKK